MKESKFDIVMDHIDTHIQEDNDTIKKGIFDLTGINSHAFGQYFSVVTGGETLGKYILSRRLYFAVQDLIHCSEKSICDIALDFGYSDQSAFTRALSAKYGVTPGEVRSRRMLSIIPNEKYHFADFIPELSDSRAYRLWSEADRTGNISPANLEYLEAVHEGERVFDFDIDTCYAIADLAERLEVPIVPLMECCFHLMINVQSDPDYVSDKNMTAAELGLHSEKELDCICEHYNCRYYELDRWMVNAYFEKHPREE